MGDPRFVLTLSCPDQPGIVIRIGRDIERRMLARAPRCVLDDRIPIDGHKTVVFIF